MPAPINGKPLNIAISGSSGLIGSALCLYLESKGHSVKRLVRRRPTKSSTREIYWNPDSGHIERHGLEDCHVVIHLGGKNIANGRWTNKQKKAIIDSRVKSTKLLSHALTKLKRPPYLFICASAVGYYGDRDDETLNEESKPGLGFLSDVCRQWEAATAEAEHAGIPVVHLRTGTVLTKRGGALSKMLPFYRVGLGGVIGNGAQYMSWISLTDVIQAIEYIILSRSIEGPVNLVSPNPIPHEAFCVALAKALHRPCAIAIPVSAVRLLFGQMGEELLLFSQKTFPNKLLNAGYNFAHAHIEEAFDAIFKKSSR